jgi:acyl carrier protein
MTNEKELFLQVEDAVRAVLDTKEGEIKMESMFRADLNTESIDFLDITFEIEKRTGVELDFPSVIKYMTEKKGTDEITDLSIADLVQYLSYLKNK